MLIQNSNAEVSTALRRWLMEAVERGASDLHLVDGYPPFLRLHGELEPLQSPTLSDTQLRSALTPLLLPATLERFLAEKNLDFASSCPDRRRPSVFA